MGNKEKVEMFDKFFSDEYNKIKTSATSILSHRDDTDDIIHNVYLTVRDRIERKGYDGDNFMGYLFRSFQNELRLAKNREKKVKLQDIEHESVQFIADWVMNDTEEDNQDTVVYRQEMLYVSQSLFRFLQTRFTEKEQYLFKTYYLSNQKMTYKDLAKQTKYEINTCSSIIKDMKKIIRVEFLIWLGDNG
jgi:RNA polymerase sigma factor (sigma-70 family)